MIIDSHPLTRMPNPMIVSRNNRKLSVSDEPDHSDLGN